MPAPGCQRAREVALLGLGAVAALLWPLLGELESRAAGPSPAPSLWVADREAGALFGLDAELYFVRRIALDSPEALAPGPDGELWVLRSRGAGAAPARRLLRIDGEGRALAEHELPWPARLRPSGDGGALCAPLAPGPPILLARADALHELERSAGAAFAEAGAPGLALAWREGRVELRKPGGDVLTRELGFPLADFAADPWGPGWWVLARGPGAGLLRLSADLEPLWRVRVADGFELLAAVPGQERAWLGDALGGELLRVGPAGVERHLREPALIGLERLLALPGGGLLALGPGALVRLGPRGEPLPSQGGFAHLVDACVFGHPR